jgi:hypothetical protein
MGKKFIIESKYYGECWNRSTAFPAFYTEKQAVRLFHNLTAKTRPHYRKRAVDENSYYRPAKLPIDRPCSACSAGDFEMEHHLHAPPFRPTPPPFRFIHTSVEQQVIDASVRAWKNNKNPWYDGLSFARWLDCKNYWTRMF